MAKKARPSVGPVRKEMTKLRDDLSAIIAAGEDKKGKLTGKQREKAEKTKKALDEALSSIKACIQLQAAF